MKNLFILTLFLTSDLFAAGYFPVGKENAITVYKDKAFCESSESQSCYDISVCPTDYCDLEDNEVLDYVAKLEVESCSSIEDCDAKLLGKSCSVGTAIKNYDLLEVYCANEVMKIDGKKIVENAAKKAAYEAAQAAKAAQEAAMEIASKSQECGKTTLALMLVRNASKGLSNAQKVQLVESTDMISKLLQLGSLDAAKGLIQSATADGTIITEGDKTALAAHIDGCKP
jgi:hypothetical protein